MKGKNKTLLYSLAFLFTIFLINADSPLSMFAAGSGLLFCLIMTLNKNEEKD